VVAATVGYKWIGQNRYPERGLCVLNAGWILGEVRKGSETVSVRNRGGGSWAVQWAITMSVDEICPLENVRNERFGCTAPLAWPGQASLP